MQASHLMWRFLFGQEIEVTTTGVLREPARFVLAGQEHVIAEIVESWADYGFGTSPPRRRRWWQRHHRNYYRVRTTSGEVFVIYYDRGTSLKNPRYKRWYVSRQL